MFFAGIDEAGLGPLLGPYCVGLSAFESDIPSQKNLYEQLQGVVGNRPGEISPVVCDSKKLYTPRTGLRYLEESVLTFFCLLHDRPDNFQDFLDKLTSPRVRDTLKSIPWFKEIEKLSLPLCHENEDASEKAGRFKIKLQERGTVLTDLALRFIPARDFNEQLGKDKNKGTLCQSAVTPLLSRVLEKEESRITVDRQGGRRYYGDWLINLMPGQPLRAITERAEMSVYRSGKREIGFYVKGDSLSLDTALASLFAKYAREAAMRLFNDYWQARDGGLKKTAGYYTDGQRFIKDLEGKGLLPENRDLLIRKK